MSARLASQGHNWLGLAAMTCMYCVAKRTAGWGRACGLHLFGSLCDHAASQMAHRGAVDFQGC